MVINENVAKIKWWNTNPKNIQYFNRFGNSKPDVGYFKYVRDENFNLNYVGISFDLIHRYKQGFDLNNQNPMTMFDNPEFGILIMGDYLW